MLKLSMDDVLSVLSLCVPYLIALGVIVVVAIIAMVACMKMKKSRKYLVRTQAGVAIVLAVVVIANLLCQGPFSTLLTLVSGQGVITEETAAEANDLCTEIAEEGIVLLQNDSDMLPLAENSNLNVFGWASTNPVYGGTGSGAISTEVPTVDLLTGLTDAGFSLNTELTDFYTAYNPTRPELGYSDHNWTLPEPTADTYSDDMMANAKEFSDTAMIVISRVGGEFADLPTDMDGMNYEENSDEYADFPAGTSYLELSQTEKDMISLVCANFDNVVLVYNGANTMELGFADDYAQIKSVIWCPGPGQTGFDALGEIVAGQVNPSGHSTDTFVYDLQSTPYFNNIGEFVYDNADELAFTSQDLFGGGETVTVPHFVNYVEGIYVGYRFYETAAAEGLINFDDTVQYTFGHGLSYTEFTQEMSPVVVGEDGSISVDVTVTNTGDVAGKEVVQAYYNPPYTNGGIEKASANLIAFDKTETLEPGASEVVTLTFNEEDMASYDTYGEGCYVLEAGDYGISIREDSHTVIAEQTVNVPENVVYGEDNARSTDAVAATNEFDFAEGEVNYLSRANQFANYAEAVAAPTNYSMTDEAKENFYNAQNWNPEDFNDENDEMPTTGAKNGVSLAELRGLDYDDPLWDTLLDEMTVTEMDDLIALGGYQTKAEASIDKYATIDCDGPANITNNFTGVSSIGFPSEVIVASSFNVDLAKAFGESIGTMADEMNVSGWYAPAVNTHRSAFDGRNFEYYSEDGYLAGMISASAIAGAQEQGVYAYMKHFALNDQQIDQSLMLCTWTNEQAMREVYLKPFEISAKVGNVGAVMSSWNYIGNTWAGACYPLLTSVLREEWGFEGMVITDGFHFTGYMDSDQAIRGGSDLMLKNFDVETNHLTDTTSATSVKAMRNSCHNILYTVVNSRAYDPENAAATPIWKFILVGVDVLIAAILVLVEVMVVRKGYKKRKELEAAEEIKVEE